PAATAPRARTAQAVAGAGGGSAKATASTPAAAGASAAAVWNSAEPVRASRPTTTVPPPCPFASSHAPSPAVVRTTTGTFMQSGPSPTGPRNPAVPNRSVTAGPPDRAGGRPSGSRPHTPRPVPRTGRGG